MYSLNVAPRHSPFVLNLGIRETRQG
jgi:hypothetical protein